MGSETQREAGMPDEMLGAFYDARIEAHPDEGYERRHAYVEGLHAGWDARSVALPSREELAITLFLAHGFRERLSWQIVDRAPYYAAADAVLSLLSGKES